MEGSFAKRIVFVLCFALTTLLILAPGAAAIGGQATGILVDGMRMAIGSVQVARKANQLRLILRLNDASVVKPRKHGISFHAVGTCVGQDFASAGGHFNPAGEKHRLQRPAGPHVGDRPNFNVYPGARNQTGPGYTFVTTSTMVTVTPGPNSIIHAGGAALVSCQGPDDQKIDRAGNSDGRIACTVLSTVAMPGALPYTGAGGTVNGAPLGQPA